MRSPVELDDVGYLDVPASAVQIGEEERAATLRVLDSGMLAQGPEVAQFESEFAAHVDGRPCVAVNSGTSALLLALVALGIGPGDEVVVPSFSFAATANAVALTGARPVFADIEPAHFCLDPSAVEAAVTTRTAAIVPVHLYGHPAPMGRIVDVAAKHGLAVVEDAAQAHLAALDGRPVGTFGQVAAFSFYPTKNMTAGEGGMVVCADEAVARTVRLLRNQGMERRYANEIVGYNMRMTDLHAAIGRVQLDALPDRTEQRRRNAAFLGSELAGTGVVVPPTAPGAAPVWHQYTVRAPDRERLRSRLADRGVGTGVYYPTPIHRLPAYALDARPARDRAGRRRGALPPGPPGVVTGPARPRRRGRHLGGGTMSRTLRAGIIGLGRMGRHHVRVLGEMPDVDLVAAADTQHRLPDSWRALDVVDTVEDLLDRGIEMCVLATPTVTHEPIAVQLAEAGVATLIEKPLAHDTKAAQNIAEAFARTATLSCVGHIERFNPALQEMRQRLAGGELGNLYQVVTRRQGPFPDRIVDAGVILDLATHDIDLTAWVTGATYRSVSARSAHRSGRPHEDLVSVVAELSNGLVVTHLVNWLSPFKERVTAVTGDKGSLVADTLTADLTLFKNGSQAMEWDRVAAFRGVVEGDVIRYAIPKPEPLVTELRNFADAVRGHTEGQVVTLEEGLATVRIAEAMRDSAATGDTVRIAE